MPRSSVALGLILSLVTLSGIASAQVGPGARNLGPEFNIYDADHIPENDPAIAQLLAEMSAEEATAILQRELAGAQLFGLDGVPAEHWGSAAEASPAPPTPQSAAAHTLVVDQQGLSWRSMIQGEEEVSARFAFAEGVQLWTRFSMAERDSSTDPPTDSPQGVVLYLLTEVGADDVFEHPVSFSKILPSYPDRLPTHVVVGSKRPLAEPGLFFEEGRPGGFAVCCFSSTGFGDGGDDPHLALERLPLVIAAFQRLAPNLEVLDHDGLLFSFPQSDPNGEEVETILVKCNSNPLDNQAIVLCQYNQLLGLAYMKYNHVYYPELAGPCSVEWVGDYRAQGECVEFTMMNHFLMENPDN